MNRPPAEQLTERELEVMHIFWAHGELSAQEARDRLEQDGRPLTYTTVATLCRILWEKEFLHRLGESRPYSFKPAKSFQEVSGHMVKDLIQKVFQGSREQLLLHIIGGSKFSKKQQKLLEQLMEDKGDQP